MEQYNNIQQAYKKEPGEERKPVSFTTPIQAVFDGKTGASLEAILAQFNSVYVQYQGTPQATRLIIPKEMRRAGLTITYMDMESNTITERANSAVQKDNDHWALDANWSRVDELSLSGDISVSAAGTWIINGQDTGVKALGPKGDTGLTPWLKTIENRLHFSYDNETWEPCSENIAAWFRWSGNKIQISRDNKTWTDLSGKFADNIHIKGYVASTAALPSGAAQGDIYGVGPTYAAEDTAHTNPIYRYYVRNANAWVDNGSFTSIAAGIVQETGDSETEVMSQKAVSERLSELGSEVIIENKISNSNAVRYFREKRNDGKGFNASGETENESDLFTLFVPCDYESDSAIKVRGIGSSHFAAVAFRNKYNNVIKVEFTPTYDEYVFPIPIDTTFCFISYYTDTKAEESNLHIFDGVTLYKRGNVISMGEKIIGEALVSEDKMVEYPDYYNSSMFYIKQSVNIGESYRIVGRNTTNSGFLYTLTDENGDVLVRANKGETDAEIIIPKGVSYLYFSASLLYPSSFERIENKWMLFDNNYVIYRGQALNSNGHFYKDESCAVSERIPLNGIKKIIAPIFPSKILPCVCFYNKADNFIASVKNNNNAFATTPKVVDVPVGAAYMRYSVFLPWKEQTYLMTDKEVEYRASGRLTNPLVKKTTAIKDVVFNANDINGFGVSMCPTITSDPSGNLYCVAEKRATQADTGIMHIYFAKKNENGWQKKIILESSKNVGRYMNPIIFYDANGVLGVANRLYVFAAKFFDIDTYVVSFTNTDDADFIYIYSDNGGETWSREFSLKQYYPNDVVLFVSSPSQAIVLQNGTFAMPGYVVKSPGGNTSLFRAGIVTFSTTNGWCLKTIDSIGNNDTENECSICEYGANSVMVNVRNFVGTRSVYFTTDVWDNEYQIFPHKSCQTFLTYDDYGCQGSVLNWNEYILLSHVDVVNVSGRQNLCIFGSYQGMTFIPLLYISMDEIIGGYANLYTTNGKLYCIYESGSNRTEVSLVEITQEINEAISKCRYSLTNDDADILQAVAVRDNL